ncbi:MAG TPA: signal peptidase I [Trueperaceae bacterium]|nr:signal peptidase I [Trueperaceae bacterium]
MGAGRGREVTSPSGGRRGQGGKQTRHEAGATTALNGRPLTPARGLLALAGGLLLGALLVSFVVTAARVTGRSMEPTLHDGDLVLLARPALDRSTLRRAGYEVGDVVAVSAPNDVGLVLKRVIAVGPVSVAMTDGVVTVAGEVVEVGASDGYAGSSDLPALRVTSDELFVLGDNRRPLASNDSRTFGPVDASAVRSRMIARLPWPPAAND